MLNVISSKWTGEPVAAALLVVAAALLAVAAALLAAPPPFDVAVLELLLPHADTA
jgi:hypothetical protein